MDNFNSFNGKLLTVIQSDRITSKHKFTLNVKSYNADNFTFTNEESVEYQPLCPETESCVIGFISCLETAVDAYIPVLLIEIPRERHFDYHFVSFSVAQAKTFLLKRLQTKRKLSNYKITDGPNVVWTAEESLFIGNTTQQNQCQLTKHLIADNICGAKIFWAKHYRQYYLIIGKKERKTDKEKDLFLYVVCHCLGAISKVVKCDAFQIISPLYTNLVDILISKLAINCGDDEEFCIESTVYAVTEEGYILKFQNGKIRFAFPGNIECDLDVQIFFHKCVPLNKYYLSIFAGRTLTTYSADDEKEAGSWSNIKQVICDDFMGNGCDQLLILSDDFDGTKGFILTDLDTFTIDNITGSYRKEEKEEEKKRNTISAVNALQSRLRNELVSLNELQTETEQRQLHITELWRRAESLNQGQLPNDTNNPMMVKLVGSQKDPVISKTLTDTEEYLKVYDIWKRVFLDNFIVGVDIRNISKSDFVYVTVTLIPTVTQNTPVLTFTTECYNLQTSAANSTGYNTSKRQKISPLSVVNFTDTECVQLESEKSVTILCTTSIPSFSTTTNIKYEIFIHLKKGKGSGDDHKEKVVFGGEITLSPLDSLGEKDKIDLKASFQQSEKQTLGPLEIQRDILALNTVQICTSLCIRSTKFPLCQMPSWLQKKAGLNPLQSYECLIFDKIKRLEDVRMYIDEAHGRKEVGVIVYTNCQDQFYLLLHHLYSVLPDDVVILPATANRHRGNVMELLERLQEEVSTVKSGISQVYEGKQLCQDMEIEEEHDNKGKLIVQNVRQNFIKRKMLIQSKSKLLTDDEEFSKIMGNVKQLQLKSDIQLIKLTTLN